MGHFSLDGLKDGQKLDGGLLEHGMLSVLENIGLLDSLALENLVGVILYLPVKIFHEEM